MKPRLQASALWVSLFITIAIITSAATQAKSINYGNATVSEVTSIYDGDTFKVTISGWHALIGERISIRVNGVEMRGSVCNGGSPIEFKV